MSKNVKRPGRTKKYLPTVPVGRAKKIAWVIQRRDKKERPIYDTALSYRNGNLLTRSNQGYSRPIKALKRCVDDYPGTPVIRINDNGKQRLLRAAS